MTLLLTVILFFYLLVLALARVNDEQPWRQLSRESALPWLGHLGHVLAPAAFGLALGVGLSAVFAVPALTENRFVRVDQWYGGRYAWGGDFVEFFQLFSPAWGSGVSVPGPDDRVSFQLGIVPVVLGLFSLVALLRRHRSGPAGERASIRLAAFFVALTAVAVWLMLAASAPLWKALPLARLVQFPWRLLAVTAVSMAFLCGVTACGLPSERGPVQAAHRHRPADPCPGRTADPGQPALHAGQDVRAAGVDGRADAVPAVVRRDDRLDRLGDRDSPLVADGRPVHRRRAAHLQDQLYLSLPASAAARSRPRPWSCTPTAS